MENTKICYFNTALFQIWWGFFTVSVTHVSYNLDKYFPKAHVTNKLKKVISSPPS